MSWPLFARHKAAAKEWSILFLRGNAWIHGSVAGAVAICLIPFIKWYMGPSWTGSRILLSMLLLRFVVAGLQNPAAYFLISASKFQVLARYIEFELIAAVVLSLFFAKMGTSALAAAFLIATAFGTFYPILSAYAKIVSANGLRLLAGLWFRALLGFLASFGIAWMLLPANPGPFSVACGVIGAVAGISLPLVFGYLKFRHDEVSRTSDFGFKELLGRI